MWMSVSSILIQLQLRISCCNMVNECHSRVVRSSVRSKSREVGRVSIVLWSFPERHLIAKAEKRDQTNAPFQHIGIEGPTSVENEDARSSNFNALYENAPGIRLSLTC